MKILILQLARLGDILMTWPTVRALRRKYPGADIQILVRPRFLGALEGLEALSSIRTLPTEKILEPICVDQNSQEALLRLATFSNELRDEQYDEVINLSYSPFSSWLTKLIAGPHAKVRGYTRHPDGWLAIADDVSSFYHAQGGVGGSSRIHLTDLFAGVCDVDLIEEDWSSPVFRETPRANKVIFHIGASESHKTFSTFEWGRLIRQMMHRLPSLQVALIGSSTETESAQAICDLLPGNVENLVGKTRLVDLFGILTDAQLVVGGDSMAMHIASLTQTPCLNLSMGRVNSYETGPKADGSWILAFNENNPISVDVIVDVILNLLEQKQPRRGRSAADTELVQNFAWDLTKALYLGAPFPVVDELLFVQAVEKLSAVNEAVLEQLDRIPEQSTMLGDLMDRADEIMAAIYKICPDVGVFVRWLQTEKARIGPANRSEIRDQIQEKHKILQTLIRPYLIQEEQKLGG